MFNRFKPVAFDPYRRRRSRWRLPRWLVLLLAGIALGAAGVAFVQERLLPPRLSAGAGAALRQQFEQADAERLRLQAALGDTARQLQTAVADKQRADAELAVGRAMAERLRDDMAAVIASLPPDPRGGSVEVRAGRFAARSGSLGYDVLLTRERQTAKPLTGVMQLVVAGESARGGEATITLKPIDLSIGSHAIVRGSQPLPEGFQPRQATVQVLDRAGGNALGMRVLLVK
jgi:hypothetical protein